MRQLAANYRQWSANYRQFLMKKPAVHFMMNFLVFTLGSFFFGFFDAGISIVFLLLAIALIASMITFVQRVMLMPAD